VDFCSCIVASLSAVQCYRAKVSCMSSIIVPNYRGADKSLAPPTSRYILFDGENIYFEASLVIYINTSSNNIPSIMIINMIYETQNLLSL